MGSDRPGSRTGKTDAQLGGEAVSFAGWPSVLYYSLKAFEESGAKRIILVTGENEIEYCRREIVEKYGFRKVSDIVAGGAERYHSVRNGLRVFSRYFSPERIWF